MMTTSLALRVPYTRHHTVACAAHERHQCSSQQCSSLRILRFFRISTKRDFLRFFSEMTCQKVVKSR